jgi:hypothetical protein
MGLTRNMHGLVSFKLTIIGMGTLSGIVIKDTANV